MEYQIMDDLCMVLEGGAQRGNFSAGVLDYFMVERLPAPQTIIGVSSGALTGAGYCCGQVGRSVRINTTYCSDWRYMSMKSFARTGDAVGKDFFYNRVQNELDPLDTVAFSKCGVKLIATCTDLETGKALYIPIEGLPRDLDFLRASATVPLVSQVVEHAGYRLFDGGVADSIPVQWALDQGFRKIIVVLTRDRSFTMEPEKTIPLIHRTYRDYPQFLNAIENRYIRYNQCRDYIWELEHKGRVFVVAPRTPVDVGSMEKDPAKIVALYNEGYSVAGELAGAFLDYLDAVEDEEEIVQAESAAIAE